MNKTWQHIDRFFLVIPTKLYDVTDGSWPQLTMPISLTSLLLLILEFGNLRLRLQALDGIQLNGCWHSLSCFCHKPRESTIMAVRAWPCAPTPVDGMPLRNYCRKVNSETADTFEVEMKIRWCWRHQCRIPLIFRTCTCLCDLFRLIQVLNALFINIWVRHVRWLLSLLSLLSVQTVSQCCRCW